MLMQLVQIYGQMRKKKGTQMTYSITQPLQTSCMSHYSADLFYAFPVIFAIYPAKSNIYNHTYCTYRYKQTVSCVKETVPTLNHARLSCQNNKLPGMNELK